MELRIPTLEQLRTVYDRDLRTAFPAAELKPLKNMEEMWAEGRYCPWCLFDGDDIAGEAFLWTICAWPQTAGTAAWAP